MTENKTRPTRKTFASYLKSIADDERRSDCKSLAAMMAKATGKTATMWGPDIVGFGKYHYVYESGREGDSCLVGFSSRKPDIVLYLFQAFPGREMLLRKLGKHRAGVGCVYIRRVEDVDVKVLEKMIAASIAEVRRRYPGQA